MLPFFFVAGFVDRLGAPFILLAFFRFVLMRMEFRVKPGIDSWHGMDNIFGTMTALVELPAIHPKSGTTPSRMQPDERCNSSLSGICLSHSGRTMR